MCFGVSRTQCPYLGTSRELASGGHRHGTLQGHWPNTDAEARFPTCTDMRCSGIHLSSLFTAVTVFTCSAGS